MKKFSVVVCWRKGKNIHYSPPAIYRAKSKWAARLEAEEDLAAFEFPGIQLADHCGAWVGLVSELNE